MHIYAAEIFIVRIRTRANKILSRISERASSPNLRQLGWVAIARRALVLRAGAVINSSASV